MSIKLSLIVAINNADRGIGIGGKLPWRISKDLKHFQKVTTKTVDISKKNAVIMGRLTWFSLPKMARPLPNRLNIVISSTINNVNELQTNETNTNDTNLLVFKSFDDAIQTLKTKYSNQIETIYAIGGSSIYKQALEYPVGFLDKIYLTRVFSSESDTKCDVFMEPANFLDNFKKLENNLQDNIFEAEFNIMHKEPANNLEYVFEVYERI